MYAMRHLDEIPALELPVRSLWRVVGRYHVRSRPPFGWGVRKDYERYALVIAPLWWLWLDRAFIALRHLFYETMIYRLKWATLSPGGHYRDVKWRWIEETKW